MPCCLPPCSRYPCENILVHEFGHTVMNVGLAAEEREAICQLYRQARQSGMYSPGGGEGDRVRCLAGL